MPVPASKVEDAGAVAQTTEFLLSVATTDTPNRKIREIAADGLKQATQTLN